MVDNNITFQLIQTEDQVDQVVLDLVVMVQQLNLLNQETQVLMGMVTQVEAKVVVVLVPQVQVKLVEQEELILFQTEQLQCITLVVAVDTQVVLVDKVVEVVSAYRLGDPTDPKATLGPVVKTGAADFVRGQIDDAVADGARSLIDPAHFPENKPGTPYLAPQVLVDVTHDMRVMTEESFGPVIGIMAVDNDAQAVELMNDSDFGLTASIWTEDMTAAEAISAQLDTGTCFANRCDYLDPGLAWTGVKDTGRGCSLSIHAYEHLTRLKSYHFRTQPE